MYNYPNDYNYYGGQSPMYNQQSYYMGGYPSYGYPSQMQSQQYYNPYPYMQQQTIPSAQNSMYAPPMETPVNTTDPSRDDFVYVPGRVHAPQLEDANGNTIDLPTPQTQSQPYVQGGKSVIEGGFNPVTGNINQPAAVQGNFEPFNNGMAQHYQFGVPRINTPMGQQPYQNPYYQPPVYNNGYGQNPYINYQQQYGYNGGMYNPQQSMYAYANNGLMNPLFRPINGVPVNDFNSFMYDTLYDSDQACVDIRSELSNIILTDEEREKANQNRFAHSGIIIGYDYFNQPIYSNGNTSYGSNNSYQEQMEKFRNGYIDHYMMCSKILHAYEGDLDKMDEEKLKKRYDPFREYYENLNRQQFKVPTTDAERREFDRERQLQNGFAIDAAFARAEIVNENKRQLRAKLFQDIKDSHDRLLGFEPGTHYTLKDYLDNGYKIGVANFKQQGKKVLRNDKHLYSSVQYSAALARKANRPVSLSMDNDDVFVPIETSIKAQYTDKKNINNVLITGSGIYTIDTKKRSELTEEDIRRIKTMNAITQMKANDDARRAAEEGWKG